MIMLRLIGGLGNQLFQYATARALAIRKGCELVLDTTAFNTYKLHSYGLGNLNVRAPVVCPSVISRWGGGYHYREVSMAFDAGLFDCPSPLYLEGYFQTELYFESARELLLEEFEVTAPLNDKTLNLLNELTSFETTVSVHVRRGDYVTNPSANAVHGTCGADYYRRARDYFVSKLISPIFIIFSDDIPWARENLDFGQSAIFVDWNGAAANYADLKLQSYCSHNIIANSSFSWWGAWLGKKPNKEVVAPEQWFKEGAHRGHSIVPSRWLRF
jgi:hypothetical protein